MKRIQLVGILLALIFLISCSKTSSQRQREFETWIQDNGKVKVLSTTAMIRDIAQQIGGEYVDTLALIQGELDPHSYQLIKGDDEKLSMAHLILSNGLGLEHGPSLQHYLRHSTKNVSLGDIIYQQDPTLIIRINGQIDPHIWMDISLWSKIISPIVSALSQKDPSHAEAFRSNAAKLQGELLQAHEEVKQVLQTIPAAQRFLVTSHDAFNYFTRAYLAEEEELKNGDWQKRFAAPEGLAPESQLSTVDIRAIMDHMSRYQIHVLFPESNVSQDSIKKIIQAGREKGMELQIACCPLYADAMGPKGSDGDTYLKMIRHNAKMIASYLENNKPIL